MSSNEFIGEGAYGCVHRPSLQCKNKKISYKNKISKIMTSKNAASELEEYSLIGDADKKKMFYLGRPVKCRVKESAANLKPLDKCKILQEKLGTKNIKKYIKKLALLVMDDGGDNLKSFSKTNLRRENNKKNQIIIEKFLIELTRMFAGMVTFHENGFLHHDIKPQNILYDIKKHRSNYIDFGLVETYQHIFDKSMNSENVLADYAFWTFPFEIQFLNKDIFVKFANMSDDEKKEYMDSVVKDFENDKNTKFNIAMQLFFEYILVDNSDDVKLEIIQKYLDEFNEMLLKYIYVDNYEMFLKRSIETTDVYGLGMTMMYVISHCRKFMSAELYQDFADCFYNMTRPNLFKRYDVYQARDRYNEIIQKSGFLQDTRTSVSYYSVAKSADTRKISVSKKTCKQGHKCKRRRTSKIGII